MLPADGTQRGKKAALRQDRDDSQHPSVFFIAIGGQWLQPCRQGALHPKGAAFEEFAALRESDSSHAIWNLQR
jgi:hypothetical protein